MAQSITLMGASYSDVPAVTLPKTGGGTAEFTDVSDTTAAAADVAAGKFFYTALGVKTEGTASGGGGVSNIVTGTFKGTTTGAAMDVTLNYSGSGYPIAVIIQPSEGSFNSTTGTFYSALQRYALALFFAAKTQTTTTPTYTGSGDNNKTATYRIYKSSASTATSQSTGTSTGLINVVYTYNNSDAVSSGGAGANAVRFKSATKMSLYIASNSYGFMANIEYTYYVIYSS